MKLPCYVHEGMFSKERVVQPIGYDYNFFVDEDLIKDGAIEVTPLRVKNREACVLPNGHIMFLKGETDEQT